MFNIKEKSKIVNSQISYHQQTTWLGGGLKRAKESFFQPKTEQKQDKPEKREFWADWTNFPKH